MHKPTSPTNKPAVKGHKPLCSMRESMPYFVSSLRTVDEWKRLKAKRADLLALAEREVNAKFIKTAGARSQRIDDLLRFLEDTVLDINFMVQLPSIEKCLDQWWEHYGKDIPSQLIDQELMRTVYYDLANVLVQAKTEMIHKNSISMILRSSWTKWNPREPPLTQKDFYRMLFLLAHLMTETNRLGDYVIFFQETLSKITRNYQTKEKRLLARKRKPRTRRKSTLVEIMHGSVATPDSRTSTPAALAGAGSGAPGSVGGSAPNQMVSVKMERVKSASHVVTIREINTTPDRFVELLDRRTKSQNVQEDPLLHEKKFQEKWRSTATHLSANEAIAERNPSINRYFPPLYISQVRLRSSPTKLQTSSSVGRLGNKLAALDGTNNPEEVERTISALLLTATHTKRNNNDEEILRRSLSRVTIKHKISDHSTKKADEKESTRKQSDHSEEEPIYLAIST